MVIVTSGAGGGASSFGRVTAQMRTEMRTKPASAATMVTARLHLLRVLMTLTLMGCSGTSLADLASKRRPGAVSHAKHRMRRDFDGAQRISPVVLVEVPPGRGVGLAQVGAGCDASDAAEWTPPRRRTPPAKGPSCNAPRRANDGSPDRSLFTLRFQKR